MQPRYILSGVFGLFAIGSSLAAGNVVQNTSGNWQEDGIARSRFENSCFQTGSMAILEGQPVYYIGQQSGSILPDNTPVCDAYGTTAIVRNRVAADLASIKDFQRYTAEKQERLPEGATGNEQRLRNPDGTLSTQ